MRDFFTAALPWIVIGLVMAVFFAGRTRRKKKKAKSDYGLEGMCIGMCVGAAIGTFFPEYIGIGLSTGMLVGLNIGMCIGKNEKDEDRGKEHCGVKRNAEKQEIK